MPRLTLNPVFPVCFAIVVLLFIFPSLRTSYSIPLAAMSTSPASWSSPYEGWHERALATPHPDPNSFAPSREGVRFAVLRNAPVEAEGLSLAFFSPPSSPSSAPDGGLVAVDALGRVLFVSPADAQGILDLARKTLDLPQTGMFRNTWILKQPRTSQPVERIFVPRSESSLVDDKAEISVQGFDKTNRELKEPVDGLSELPDSLWELAGLVLEAREGASVPGGDKRNGDVLGKVKDVLSDLF